MCFHCSLLVFFLQSVGICFIGRRNFQSFIEDYIEPQEGNFINIEDNRVVGKHKGMLYICFPNYIL